MVSYSVIGQSTSRVEAPEKVTGRAKYGIDMTLPGMLWCRVLRSPYPRARIVRVDVAKARQLPGVHAVLTGGDVRGMRTGGTHKDEPVLAWDEVLFVGDKVAAVAADDEDIAQRALDLIEVEYEEMPAVFDAMEAARPGAPLLHPEFNSYQGVARKLDQPSNVYTHILEERGNLAAGFAAADVVIERTYRTMRTHQGYLEPHACLVLASPNGEAQVWVASQGPFANRNELVRLMGLKPEQVTINFSYIGGSFGGKTMFTGVPICHLLSKATGRPVKLVLDYAEEFQAANPRHPATMRIKAGVRRDGALTAWQAEAYLASGAYTAYAPIQIRHMFEMAGPYRIPHLRIDSYQVYTDTVPCGFMRSPGEVQAIFAGESHIDELARAIGMDPLEFRLKNIIHEGDEMPDGRKWQAVRLEETLRAAAEAAGYYEEKPASVGRGIAIGHRSTGGGAAHGAVTVHPDGRIVASLPSFDQGGGLATALALVVAEELRVPVGRVTITPDAPFDVGTGGSRGTRVMVAAGTAAAKQVKQKLQSLAAEFLGWSEERITFQDGNLVNTNTQERVPLEKIAARTGGPVAVSSVIEEPPSPYTSFAAHIAEVSVDPETGQVSLRRYTAAQDTGLVLNRLTFQGQVEGGIVYALGQTLMEELVVEEGRVTNPSFADFKLPTVRDIPELHTVILESSQHGDGPYNLRGIGEHSNITVAPAVANAVADASGARVGDLPITAEKVRQALREVNGG